MPSLFNVDIMSREPIYEQLISQIEKYVIGGILSSGDKIPSVRSLSLELAINPNTIQKAYSELDSKGIISSVPGKGCFISQNAKETLKNRERTKLVELTSVLKRMRDAGVSKQEITDLVNDVFNGEVKNND